MTGAAGLRFLVVEDHGFQRWLIGNLLDQLGAASVRPFNDGRAAMEFITTPGVEVDVVISDLDMPGMDGMQLIRQMSERRATAALIVVSALEPALLATVATMAREYGVNFLAAIQKPLNAKKLREALALLPSVTLGTSPAEGAKPLAPEEIADGLRQRQFEAFFQPKVEIRTGCLRGGEALARWRHPERGIVNPHEFMDAIEAHGLIGELTDTMVEQAVAACGAWRRAGLELTVSVNVSSLSLSDVTLTDRVIALVSAGGLEPSNVILEITESAANRDLGHKLENLTRLRMKGFGLSIDDYGTGYSSMHRLSRIPFTELKVDQVFVRGATKHVASRAMVESSLDLARTLGITAVAEGIEDRAEWELLLGLGCQLAQGYYIAQPMPAAQFPDWAHSRREGCA